MEKRKSAPVVEILAPRVLYSADPLGLSSDLVLPDENQNQTEITLEDLLENDSSELPAIDDELLSQERTLSSGQSRTEVIFVDTLVADHEQIVESLKSSSSQNVNYTVYTLTSSQSIDDIGKRLAQHSQLDAIHVISHGNDASIVLGSTVINKDSIANQSGSFEQWGQALTEGGDLLFYGCNLAESSEGQQLVAAIADASNADVGASENRSGHESRDADWQLEFSVGQIDTDTSRLENALESWRFHLALITVNTTDDGPLDYTDGDMTLREAIAIANTNGDPNDVIVLSDASSYQLNNGDLDINSPMVIVGAPGTTIIAENNERVFEVQSAGEVTLSDLTIEGGAWSHGAGIYSNDSDLRLTNVKLSDNHADTAGGAIYVESGGLTVRDSEITSNSADIEGGGIYINTGNFTAFNSIVFANNTDGTGGGIYQNTDSTITLNNVEVFDNTAQDSGGGIFQNGGMLTAVNLNMTLNESITGSGGGAFIQGAASIHKSTFVSNSAPLGGGIYVQSLLTASDSTFSSNEASSDGGAIFSEGTTNLARSLLDSNKALSGSGGGIYSQGTTTITDSTLTGNDSQTNGAAVYSETGWTTINRSTIVDNEVLGLGENTLSLNPVNGNSLAIQNTLITNHSGTPLHDDVISLGNNLFDFSFANSHPDDFTESTANIDLDNTLQDNGGEVLSYRLLPGSTAIDSGTATPITNTLSITDTTGAARDNLTDIGAYEFRGTDVTNGPSIVINEGLELPIGGTEVISPTSLVAIDPDSAVEDLVFTITTVPQLGDLMIGATVATGSSTFTTDDLNTGNVTYVHTAAGTNLAYDKFSFFVHDEITDGTHDSQSYDFNIAINGDNVAPELIDETYTLNTQTENDSDPAGTAVNDILLSYGDAFPITDLNTGSKYGISVNSVNDSNGVWEFKLAPGDPVWSPVQPDPADPVYDGNSLLLETTSLLRFVPDTDFSGQANIGFRAHDFTSGPPAGSYLVDNTPYDSSPFPIIGSWGPQSTIDAQAVATVIPEDPIHIAHTLPGSVVTLEDEAYTFTGPNQISIDDSSGSDYVLAVTLQVDNGKLNLTDSSNLTVQDNDTSTIIIEGLRSDINASLSSLVYTPDANYNGPDELLIYSSYVPDRQLLYTFDNTSGTTVPDENYGTANDGEAQNGANISNPYLRLDGNDDSVTVEGTNFGITDQVTLATWVDLAGSPNNKSEIITINDNVMISYSDDTKVLAGNFSSDASITNQTSELVNLSGSRYHIAYTVDTDTNYQALYVDGVLLKETNHLGALLIDSTDPRTTIGASSTGADPFRAKMDDVEIFSRALSPEEVQAVYGAGTLPTPLTTIEATDVIDIDVRSVNDIPSVGNLATNLDYTIGTGPTPLAPNAFVSDPELDQLNGGNSDYTNAVLTIGRSNPDDRFYFYFLELTGTDTFYMPTDSGNKTIATFTVSPSGDLSMTFTDEDTLTPTSSMVSAILNSLRYSYEGAAPDPAPIVITLNDGNTGDNSTAGPQGIGGPEISTDKITVDITEVPDFTHSYPVRITLDEDSAHIFDGSGGFDVIQIEDSSGKDYLLRVQLDVTGGILSLPNTSNADLDIQANNSSSVVIEGLRKDINSALLELSYTPFANYHNNGSTGVDTLTIHTSATVDREGFYTFSSATPLDSSGTSNDGILVGDAFIWGAYNVLKLDEDNNGDSTREGALDFPIDFGLTSTGEITFSTWVAINPNANKNGLFSIGDRSVALYYDAAKQKVTAEYRYGPGVDDYNATHAWGDLADVDAAGDSIWHHIAYTLDTNNNQQTIYVDGTAVTTSLHTEAIQLATASPGTTVGAISNNGNYDDSLDGLMDDVEFFSRALSAEEIEYLHAIRPPDKTDIIDAVDIGINSINDVPQLSSIEALPAVFTEDNLPVGITGNLAIADDDHTILQSAKIAITNNHIAGEDELVIVTNPADPFPSSITPSYDPATGVMEFTGAASLADYQKAIRDVHYQNTSENPNSLDRTVGIAVNDSEEWSNRLTRDISIVSVNDAPALSAIETTNADYIENDGPLQVTDTTTVSDVDDTIVESAVIAITGNFTVGEDELLFVDQSGISGSYDNATGTLTLTGSATHAEYQSALQSVAYYNASEKPSDLLRTVQFTINDGDVNSNTISRDIRITSINDAPILSTIEALPLTYTENASPVGITGNLSLADPDDTNVESATIAITGNFVSGEDELSISLDSSTGISGSFDAVNGVLTLSGTATVSAYEAAIHSVKYKNLSDNPTTADRTISFTINDGESDSNTLSRDINILALNDAPAIPSLNGTLYFTEGEAPVIVNTGIDIEDPDSPGLQSAQISISNNFITGQDELVADTSILNSLYGISASFDVATGTLQLSGSASADDYQQAIRSVSYFNHSEHPSSATRTLSYTINDGLLDSNTRSHSLKINPVNDAPSGEDHSLATKEDTPLTLQSGDFGFSDVAEDHNFGAVTISQVPGSGTLSLAGVPVAINQTISITDIVNSELTFTPAPGAYGTAYTDIMFRVHDDGGIANGGIDEDQSPNRLNIDVLSVNDAPTGTDNTLSTDEDAALVLQSTDFGFSDPSDSDNLAAVTISQLPGNGTLTLDGNAVTANQTISITNINNDELIFTPAPDAYGPALSNITFSVHDDGGSANGGIDADQTPNILIFDVHSVNDAPSGTDNTLSTNEDTPLILQSADFGFSDVLDGDNLTAVAISQLPTNGTLTLAGSPVTLNQAISVTNINNGDLTFTPVPDASGVATSLLFNVIDNGGTARDGTNTDPTANTLKLEVVAVNDAPAGEDKTLLINEDTVHTLKGMDFGFSDPVDGDNFAAVTITGLPSNGTLTLAGNPVTLNQTISITSINNSELKFTPVPGDHGTAYSNIMFSVHDDGDTVNGGIDVDQTPNTLTFDVLSVNDAPAGTDNTLSTGEDTALTLQDSDFGFSDGSDGGIFAAVTISQLPTNGTLFLAGNPVILNQTISITDIGNGDVTFAPAPNASGIAHSTMMFKVIDDGGTANGGTDTDQSPNTLKIDVLSVNDAPAGTDNTLSTKEDTTLILQGTDFGFSDALDGDNFAAVTINQLPTTGTLTLDGSPVAPNQLISITAINNGELTFTPFLDASGPALSSFMFSVHDNGGIANGGIDADQTPNTLTVDVLSVNDAPTGTDNTLSTDEDTPLVLQGPDFGFSDTPEGHNFAAVTISQLPVNGTLTLASNPVTLNQTISITNINSGELTFTPALDASGPALSDIRFSLHDDGGIANGGIDADQTPNTLTVDVFSVNDAPTGTDNTLSTNEDTPLVLQGPDFGFSDTPEGHNFAAVTISLLPVNGTLTLASSPVTLNQTISITDINNGELTFTPVPGASGSAYSNFMFSVLDDGGSASGGIDADQTPNTLTVDVLSVNDAPTGSDNILSTNEDTTLVLQSIDFGFSDTSEGHNFAAVTINQLPTNGTLTFDGNLVTPNQTISITNINSGDLSFTPAPNANGIAYSSVKFSVHDDGGIANGGVDADQTPNTLTFNVAGVNDSPIASNITLTSIAEDSTAPAGELIDTLINSATDIDTVLDPTHTQIGVAITQNNAQPENGHWQYFDASGTWQDIGAVSPANALLLDNSNKLRFLPVDNYVGTPQSLTAHVVDSSFSGTQPYTSAQLTGGTTPFSNPVSISTTVTNVNDAPVIADAVLQPIPEDTSATAPIQVIDLFDADYTDIDGTTAIAGIAITGNPSNATQGIWQYSANGSDWYNVNSVSDSTALLIKHDAFVRFSPAADFNGNAAELVIRAVDGTFANNFSTDNSNREILDTSTAGTMVSDEHSISIAILPVNDEPSGSDNTIDVIEEDQHTFNSADFGFSDPVDADDFFGITVRSLPANGSLLLNGIPVDNSAWISAGKINNGSLSYITAADSNSQDSWDFAVSDNGGTTNNGVDRDQSDNTITINILPVNDAPAGSDSTIAAIGGTPVSVYADNFGFTDPADNHNLDAIIIDSLPSSGVVSLNNVPVSVYQQISIADINTGALTYTGTVVNSNSQSDITFRVMDSGGTDNGGQNTASSSNTLTFIVTPPANTPPASANSTVSVNEDASYSFSVSDFNFSDPADGHSFDAVLIIDTPALGSLTLNNTEVTAGTIIPVTDISALTFTPKASESGPGYTSFEFKVIDNGTLLGGGSNTSVNGSTITFDVVSVNDAPLGSDTTLYTDESTPLVLDVSDFGFSDPADQNSFQSVTIVALPTDGTLLLDQSPVTQNGVINVNDIVQGLLTFVPAPLALASSDEFEFKVTDDGGTANNGVDTSSGVFKISIGIATDNNPPAGSDNTIALDEDSTIEIDAALFGYTDSADGHSMTGVLISTPPSKGELLHNGSAVVSNTFVSIADLNAGLLTFQPEPNESGPAYADIGFKVFDNGNPNSGKHIAATESTLTIDVNPVNDTPTDLTLSGTAEIMENSSADNIGNVTFSDVDTSDTHQFSVSDDRFDIVNGALGLKPGTTLDYENEPLVPLQITVTDSAGASSTHDLVLQVLNVNEAPEQAGELNSVNDQTSTAPFSFALPDGLFTDVDTDVLSYTATQADGSALPGWLQFEDGTFNISDDAPPQSIDVVVVATDPGGLSASVPLTISVEPEIQAALPTVPVEEPTVIATPVVPETTEASDDVEVATTEPAEEQSDKNDEPVNEEEQFLASSVSIRDDLDDQRQPTEVVQFSSSSTDSLRSLINREALGISMHKEVDILLTAANDTEQTRKQMAYNNSVLQRLATEADKNLDDLNSAVMAPKVLATSVTLSSGFSVGYILWMLRGGTLLASVMASMPAWRAIDPLPVLESLTDNDENDTETLESMVEETNSDNATDPKHSNGKAA